MSVVTRIAPSPTGFLHFGLARTALFSYLYSKREGGTFILRIEDTDVARNKPEFEADIDEQMAWLGLTPDARYRQSEHVARHTECLEALVQSGAAYISKEPAKDDPSRTVEVVRLRNAGERITFTDLIRGEISFDTTELGDFVLARSMHEPLYHMAVVVDDHDEGVTHVIRGEDHISNTQRHILIQRALGFTTPAYAHLPLILMPDKSKMSKRKHESSVRHYREEGILPDALINYLALLGWNPGTEQEIFSIQELIAAFDIAKINKSGAVFDREKLLWFNREYIQRMSPEAFTAYAEPAFRAGIEKRGIAYREGVFTSLIPLLMQSISTSGELADKCEAGEYDYFFVAPSIDTKKLPQKGDASEIAARHLGVLHEKLSALDAAMFSTPERLKDEVWEYATIEGRGSVLWPMRYALSGRDRSPDPFQIASLIGKDETLRRIQSAKDALSL